MSTSSHHITINVSSIKIYPRDFQLTWYTDYETISGVPNTRLLRRPVRQLIEDAARAALQIVGLDEEKVRCQEDPHDDILLYYFRLSADEKERTVQCATIKDYVQQVVDAEMNLRRLPTLTEIIKCNQKMPPKQKRDYYIRKALHHVGVEEEYVERAFQIADICTRPLDKEFENFYY